jgi:hypothetical protein
LNRAPSSHVLCSRVRTMSVSILSRERAPALRPTHSEHFSRSEHHPSSPSSRSSGAAHCCALQRHCRDGPASTDRSASQAHFACGSLRRQPTLAHAAIRAALRPHANRPGLPPPALLVSCICQPCFMLDRPWAPALQRFLPARRRPSRLPLAWMRFPPVLHAVSRLAAPRLRGIQPSCGRVLRRPRCSRVRRVAPLLVVSPLRG